MDLTEKNKSSNWIFLAVLAIAFIIIYSKSYDEKLAILGDNASYYLLGKGISEGKGYTNYFSPVSYPHNHFPPGYPFLLSIIMLFTSSITVMKLLNGVLLFGTVILTYLTVARMNIHKGLALVIALAVMMNANLLYYGSIMMSEVPFAFFSLLSIFLALVIDWKERVFKNWIFYLLLILLVYCFYLRAFGVAVVGAVILYSLSQRAFIPSLAVAAGFILGILPWQIRSASLGGSSQLDVLFRKNFYTPEAGNIDFGDMLDRIGSNVVRLFTIELPQSIFPVVAPTGADDPTFGMVVWGILLLGIMIFAAWKLRLAGLLLGSYLMLTLGILFLWPDYFSSMRYLAPALPVSAILFFYGIYVFANLALGKIHKTFQLSPYLMLLLLFLLVKPLNRQFETAKMTHPPQWAHYFTIAEWSAKNTPHDAVISCRKPFLFYLISNRRSTHYKYSDTPSEVIEDFRNKGVDYVVYDQLGFGTTPRYLGPAINANKQLFTPVVYLGPEQYRTYLFKLSQ